ncbi:DUF1361 domain-containing protein [Dyadobacter pollutisoli]|uniref:DUF1361 domain-containing protein n=1 Tax=Dyadobacter pollutisoli TaxID=2910158 RepID=A0A9E8NAW2_9BACT|nr:DUF1361 domain-containing protein [Dyadobacter pollutisoli]WAC13240.1 DUF1361 domain-containing protein [Dyadobacter pollutisoli]
MDRLIDWIRNYKFSVSDPPIITMEGVFSLLLLLLLSIAAVTFHLIRILFNSPVDFSLDWNLFLSWIPLIIAFLADTLTKRFDSNVIIITLLSVTWIAFLPNAPYMITDLAHLTVDYQRDLTWHDIIMLFSYAEVSLFNGLVSLYWIHRSWRRVFEKRTANILLLISLPLAGFGVYLGRVRRMNSWDIIHEPEAIIKNLFESILDRTAWVFSMEIGMLLGILYLVLWAIIRFRIRHSRKS